MKNERFIIIGAGIAGLTTAFVLEALNLPYILVEAQPEVRGIGAGFGLASNAMKGFDFIGIENDIHAIGHTIDALKIVDQKGKSIIVADTNKLKDQLFSNFAVHRADLHAFLLQKIDASCIKTSKKFQSFEEKNDLIEVTFEDGTTETANYLIAADGVNSKVRRQLIPASIPRYAGYVCWRAVIKNPGIDLSTSIETWGSNGRFGLTPLINDQIYWYACINASKEDATIRRYTIEELRSNFANYHSTIPTVLAHTLAEQLICNDIIDVTPISKYHYSKVLLIGDAAHATTPNMGQGACMAIEDVAVLKKALQQTSSVEEAFMYFNEKRVNRANAIIRDSDLIGKVAQIQTPLLIHIRNFLMRSLPEYFATARLKKLLSHDFLK